SAVAVGVGGGGGAGRGVAATGQLTPNMVDYEATCRSYSASCPAQYNYGVGAWVCGFDEPVQFRSRRKPKLKIVSLFCDFFPRPTIADVIDAWAAKEPRRTALLSVNEEATEASEFTFSDLSSCAQTT